jgi:hypothetical protein
MRTIIFALIALLFFTQPALARTSHPIIPQQQTVITDNDLVESGTYTNVDGKKVHRPAHTKSGKAPTNATAKCRDNSYSFSTHHRGTCSRHGGVAAWLN